MSWGCWALIIGLGLLALAIVLAAATIYWMAKEWDDDDPHW